MIEQLREFYHKYDEGQGGGLNDDELDKYHQNLIDKDRLVTYSIGDALIGYIESWRVSYEQLGRILLGEKFNLTKENINNGSIAYVANITILPDYRKREVLKIMKSEFFRRNYMCDYFVGEAHHNKRVNAFKVYNKQDFYDKYLKGVQDVI